MTIERVLVAGATGGLGKLMVAALRERDKTVVASVSLDDSAALDRAVEQVDAVVSCVGSRPDTLLKQRALIAAAKRSGSIQRLIPSQFGIDSRTYENGRVTHGDTKRELQSEFDGSGIPITYVHANGFATFWASSLGQLGLAAPPEKVIQVFGTGDVKMAMTVPMDIARYTVRTLDDPRTENRHVTIMPADNLFTQNELIAFWQTRAGVELQQIEVTSNALDDQIEVLSRDPARAEMLAFVQLVRAAWIDGLGGKRRPDVLEATELYPDVRYERITEYLTSLAAERRPA